MKKIILILSVITTLFSCEKDSAVAVESSYDRTAILTNWADNIIIPSFQDNVTALEALDNSVKSFESDTNLENLQAVKSNFLIAYKKWQHISLYTYGPSEDANLVSFANIHPVNVEEINANILDAEVDLTSLSKFNSQGFPALDYLLYGKFTTEGMTLEYYKNTPEAKSYLVKTSARLLSLVKGVSDTWSNSFRDAFVANNGDTNKGALNQFTNSYIEHFEKNVRSAKIGTPAGKFSTKGQTYPDKVEAFYSKEYSKELVIEAIKAHENLFEGKVYNGTTIKESFKSYLDDLKTKKGTENLSDVIMAQFQAARESVNLLDNNLAEQVASDNNKMLASYDEINKIVLYTKTNMLTALNIVVDYVDNDGD